MSRLTRLRSVIRTRRWAAFSCSSLYESSATVAAQLGILRAEPPVGLLQPLIGDLRRVRRRLLDRARHRRAVLARVVSVSSPRHVGKFYRSRRGRQEETSRPLSLFIFLVGPFLAYTQVRGGTPPPTTYCAA